MTLRRLNAFEFRNAAIKSLVDYIVLNQNPDPVDALAAARMLGPCDARDVMEVIRATINATRRFLAK
jgi:hypothetical protein